MSETNLLLSDKDRKKNLLLSGRVNKLDYVSRRERHPTYKAVRNETILKTKPVRTTKNNIESNH